MSVVRDSYEILWDIALPNERTVNQGIIIKVIDANGNPLEGIPFNVEDAFLDFRGQTPGSGSFSVTTPSDPNGIIVITPAMPVKSVFTYDSIKFEIEYSAVGTLVEKTVIIN